MNDRRYAKYPQLLAKLAAFSIHSTLSDSLQLKIPLMENLAARGPSKKIWETGPTSTLPGQIGDGRYVPNRCFRKEKPNWLCK